MLETVNPSVSVEPVAHLQCSTTTTHNTASSPPPAINWEGREGRQGEGVCQRSAPATALEIRHGDHASYEHEIRLHAAMA